MHVIYYHMTFVHLTSSKNLFPNAGAYLVEKGYWLLHARHCRTQAGSSVIRLTDTTLSEDPELWNQLRVLQFPSKMIIFLWRIILNAHLVRAELRRQIRTEELYALLCPRYTIGHIFFLDI